MQVVKHDEAEGYGTPSAKNCGQRRDVKDMRFSERSATFKTSFVSEIDYLQSISRSFLKSIL